MSVSLRVALAVISAGISWYVFYKTALYFERADAVFIANAILVSIFVHELGHMVALWRHGIRSSMIFLVVLAGVSPIKQDLKKYERLNDAANVEVALAGVIANVFVFVGGFVVYATGFITWDSAMRLLHLNCALILFNLIPFWFLDGYRFVKMLFKSVHQERDRIYMMSMATVVIFAGFVTFLLGNAIVIPTALMVFGFIRRMDEEPGGSYLKTAMTERQQCWWTRAYLVLVLIGMMGTALTKPWL